MMTGAITITVALAMVLACMIWAPGGAEAYGGISTEPVLQNLQAPWDVAFGQDGWWYVSTRPGVLYGIHDGEMAELLRLPVGGGEGGMLGIATLDNMVYVYHTAATGNQVTRYIHDGSGLVNDAIIIQNIPAALHHNGGRIQFGPDSMLYVATGDAGIPKLSQDVSSLAGKILRLNSDGSIPNDNPVQGSPVYAYGLRNPQGLAWDHADTLYVTDHGPSGFFQRAHDEINRIVPYGNYGWPDSVGDNVAPGTIPPLIHSGDVTWAPSGLVFASEGVPMWNGMLLYGALRGEHLGVVSTDGSDHQVWLAGELGRIRTPIIHPNGTLYLLTTNTDGRGAAGANDDVLVRVVPDPYIPGAYSDTVIRIWDMYRNGMISEGDLETALDYLASLPETLNLQYNTQS